MQRYCDEGNCTFGKYDKYKFIAIVTLCYVSIFALDAICQGMTSLTSNMENRLSQMTYGHNTTQPRLIHFMLYFLCRYLTFPLYYLFKQWIAEDDNTDNIWQVKTTFTIFGMCSLAFMTFCLLYIKELRQKALTRPSITLLSSLSTFYSFLSTNYCWRILILFFLLRLHPVNIIDVTLLARVDIQRYGLWRVGLDFLPDVTLLLFVYGINRAVLSGAMSVVKLFHLSTILLIGKFLSVGLIWMWSQGDWAYIALCSTAQNFEACTPLVMFLIPVYLCLYYGKEGYESFLINCVRTIYSFAVEESTTIGFGYLQTYLDNRFYSPKAVGYMMIFGIELSLLLSTLVYLFIPSTPPLSSPPTAIHSNSDHKSLEESRLTRPQ